VGYSWILGGLVNLKAGIGVQYEHLGVEARSDDGAIAVTVGTDGVMPAADLTLGVVF
jgi:hypothetical protein